ncbi:DNA-binding domain-containing protein [uncultured Chryseobacterium sp.]|uniref:DNA-binding domain-containing protein n=1 Tax=uncultured Chryseobacterium sp. TaxID=259322 RepID=UPI0025FD700C|nr:DNA-binding domain-containing protein [uncultured Chryseobacterium sp.]
MPILHKIKAYLYDNYLTKDNPDDFIARTISERSLNVKQICESAANRGGADVSAAAMEHATELFLKEMAYQLCDGYSVNTGYFTASTNIRGVFDSPSETFNPQKHSILFQFNQGEKLRSEIPNIEINILGTADATSSILQVKDVKSGTVNDILTPGRNLKISGSKIKLAGDNAANGIFFTDAATQTRTAVDASDIVVNNPSELIVVIPALSAGTYTLEVVTQFAQGSLLKEPRTAGFDKVLTVQ